MKNAKMKGFTLLEMILVLVIMGSILVLIVNYSSQRMNQYRNDLAATQMQQILNAGLAYYIQYGVWPITTCGGTNISLDAAGNSPLQTNGFLPNQAINPPWGGVDYEINCVAGSTSSGNATGYFTAQVNAPSLANAQILAGELPMATLPNGTSSPFTVTAQVLVPGQSLSNARSLNYAGIYYSGACVPVPTCPASMKPEVVVVPEGVAGVYNAPLQSAGGSACTTSSLVNSSGTVTSTGNCGYISASPITNYEAFATGGTNQAPPSCSNSGTTESCYSDVSGSTATAVSSTSGNYWRVCLSVGSEPGNVNSQIISAAPYSSGTANSQGLYWTQAMGTIVAFTRCVPSGGEPTGSSLNVWSP